MRQKHEHRLLADEYQLWGPDGECIATFSRAELHNLATRAARSLVTSQNQQGLNTVEVVMQPKLQEIANTTRFSVVHDF